MTAARLNIAAASSALSRRIHGSVLSNCPHPDRRARGPSLLARRTDVAPAILLLVSLAFVPGMPGLELSPDLVSGGAEIGRRSAVVAVRGHQVAASALGRTRLDLFRQAHRLSGRCCNGSFTCQFGGGVPLPSSATIIGGVVGGAVGAGVGGAVGAVEGVFGVPHRGWRHRCHGYRDRSGYFHCYR
jgi:hypothetical protein